MSAMPNGNTVYRSFPLARIHHAAESGTGSITLETVIMHNKKKMMGIIYAMRERQVKLVQEGFS